MIIIGHPWIESKRFCTITTQEELTASTAEDVVLLEPLNKSYTLAHYCKKNMITFAVKVDALTEALFSNALGASYIICEADIAKQIQPIAQEYLFDTRILVPIDDEKEIEKLAHASIDGVIFREVIQDDI